MSTRLDPELAYRAGAGLADAGAVLAKLRQDSGGRLEAASTAKPWGNDEVGGAFDANYAPNLVNLLAAWQDIASFVETMGVRAAEAVIATVEADVDAAAAAAAVRRTGEGA
jgi:hypothetical protein